MKIVLNKKSICVFIAGFVMTFCVVKLGFAQGKTPYPIIFVHGLNSCDTTWGKQNKKFDNIIDYLEGAGLTNGHSLNISLNYAQSSTSLNVPMAQDVHLFTTNPSPGDFYTINFDVTASGKYPIVHRAYSPTLHRLNLGDSVVMQPLIINPIGISSTDISFDVNYPEEFQSGDIISVSDEFMNVISVTGVTLTVGRHLLGSLASTHNTQDIIVNLSNESNQASIVKQGYALKLAIDAIKSVTGAKKVILVGHSMGGLAAREYIKTYSQNDIAKIVTIGTPHYGANISDLPNSLMALFGIDGMSDAVRDLRASIPGALGVYLFGGFEGELNGYYSQDVNANGVTTDLIDGLNSSKGYASLQNIAHTWIASNFLGNNDGIVLTRSEYIYSGDTLMTNKFHTSEPSDYYTLLRGLDEPQNPSLAYEITPNSTTKGFITFNQGNSVIEENPADTDLFKIIIPNQSTLKINITASLHTGISSIKLLNADQTVRKSTTNIFQPITDNVSAGTYYIQINGNATHATNTYPYDSYKFPYTLTTTTTVIPPSNLSNSATKLSYYDVVLNQSITKNDTLTNNSTAPISVSSLSLTGPNADQFSITGPPTFNIAPGQTQIVGVNFNPTSVGQKNAVLQVANNSTDNPTETIPLKGNGVANPTKKLVINPDSVYNYGGKTITIGSAKIFNVLDTGSNKITIFNLTLTGPNASEFSLSTQAGVPFDVNPNGGTSQFTVNFTPASVGSKTAQLLIANNSDNKAPNDTVTLYGNGTNSIYTGITGNIIAYEYWFDTDYASKVNVPVTPQGLAYLNANFPTTGLITGSHVLHIRYEDQKGQWSSVLTENFYKAPLAPAGNRQLVSYEYWFDNNYAAKVDTSITPAQAAVLSGNIDTKSLTTGTHTFNIRYQDDNGQWSSAVSTVFNKMPLGRGGNRKIVDYEYWFDNNYTMKVSVPVTPGQTAVLNSSIDATLLPVGSHTYNLRYEDDLGQWSSIETNNFYKIKAQNGPNLITTYRYWYDTDSQHITTVNLPAPVSPLALSTNLNAGKLANGSHTVQFQFKDTFNSWSSVAVDTFSVSQCNIIAPVITTQCQTLTSSSNTGNQWYLNGGSISGATSQTYVAAQNGNYTVVVTDTSGCSATSLASIINVNPLTGATITASGPTSFCQGDSVKLTANAGVSYLWSNGATTQAITVTTTGNYSVTVSTAGGCSATSLTTTVTLNPLATATITASGPTSFCQGDSVKLTASTGASYLWSNGATTQSITVTTAGNYLVTVSNASVCSALSAPTAVTINPLPAPTITAATTTTFCQGGNVTLTASAGNSYLWSNGATTQSIIANTAGDYTVTVSNSNGCSAASSAITVIVNPLPIANITASGPTNFCQGDSVKLTASAGTSYLWSNGATTQSIDVTTTGNYSVTVSNTGGCTATSATTVVTVNTLTSPVITASSTTTFCQGGSVTLTASTANSYLWSNGAATQTINVNSSGSYTVTTTNLNGCTSTSVATVVTVNSPPVAAISPSGTVDILSGSTTLLTANPGTGYTYQWSKDGVDLTNQTSATLSVSSPGSYVVNVSANGCMVTSLATVVNTVFILPPSNFKLTITSATCKWSNNGSVNITAAQSLNYTATITGNGLNTAYPFTTSQDISNLTAGTYNICITIAGQSGYQQCFDVVVTEPQDLSVYSLVNISTNTLNLALSGGTLYNIQLNGVAYTTTNSSISLPLKTGNNDLSVTTDRLCQGSVKKTINVSDKIIPYPDPFKNTLSVNLGPDIKNNVSIQIVSLADGTVVFSKQYGNLSDVIQLDLGNLKTGAYSFQLSSDNSANLYRIVKQ